MRVAQKVPVSEKDFQAAVIELAQLTGFAVYHTADSRRSQEGFPDLVAIRPPRVLFCELKRDGAKPTPAQEAWLISLQSCPGVEAHLWRPKDWDDICEALR